MQIVNYEEITAELAGMLRQFDIDLNKYQTDVYLYIDDAGRGTLDLFVNVGGNSWIDDDHYTIYSDKQHYNTIFDCFDNPGDLLEAAGITAADISPDELSYYDIECYIKEHSDLYDKVNAAYIDCLPDSGEYDEAADRILQDFLAEQRELEEMRDLF